MANGRYLSLSTFQCVADVSVWRVTVCDVCQYVVSGNVLRVSVWRVSACGGSQCVSCVIVWRASVCGGCRCVAGISMWCVNVWLVSTVRGVESVHV